MCLGFRVGPVDPRKVCLGFRVGPGKMCLGFRVGPVDPGKMVGKHRVRAGPCMVAPICPAGHLWPSLGNSLKGRQDQQD